MKVILLKNGSLIDVSEGHARNYLLPKKLAEIATPNALKELQKRLLSKEQKVSMEREEQLKNKALLESLQIDIKAEAGDGGRLFGSITKEDIASAVKTKSKLDIDKKKIQLDDHIRHIGEFLVSIKLFPDVLAKIKVKVVPSK